MRDGQQWTHAPVGNDTGYIYIAFSGSEGGAERRVQEWWDRFAHVKDQDGGVPPCSREFPFAYYDGASDTHRNEGYTVRRILLTAGEVA